MKKLWTFFLTLAIPASVCALPLGNPWEASLMRDGVCIEGHCADFCDPVCMPDAWSVRIGFAADFVYDRNLELDRSNDHATIHNAEITTTAAIIALNFYDRVDIFGTLGASTLFITANQGMFSSPFSGNGPFAIDVETDFSWSIGARGTLLQCGCLGLGIEGQYFETRPNLNSTYRIDSSGPFYAQPGEKAVYKEWQVGLGAAYRVNLTSCDTALVPYAGISWSDATVDFGEVEGISQTTLYPMQTKERFGYAIGMTLLGCSKATVTIEGRFVSEKAFHVNTQFRF